MQKMKITIIAYPENISCERWRLVALCSCVEKITNRSSGKNLENMDYVPILPYVPSGGQSLNDLLY
jgi:hypothetical protein